MDIQDIVVSRVPRTEVDNSVRSLKDAAKLTEDEVARRSLLDAVEVIEKMSEGMYNLSWEKNLLVCLASKGHQSSLSPHVKNETGWDPMDGWLVYIQLPTGQVSFHIDHETRGLLAGKIPLTPVPVWDGHDLSEKWKRVMKYITGNV